MMIYIRDLSGAIIVFLAYYMALRLLEKKECLVIKTKSAIMVGMTTFISLLIIGLDDTMYSDLIRVVIDFIMIISISVLAVTDYQTHLVPNKILLFMLALWSFMFGIYMVVNMHMALQMCGKSLFGAIVGGSIFFLCYVMSKGQLGAGDVKLSFVLGLYATSDRIIGIIAYGMAICCIYSVIMLVRKKIGMKDGVPLVPFLYLGTLVTLLIL